DPLVRSRLKIEWGHAIQRLSGALKPNSASTRWEALPKVAQKSRKTDLAFGDTLTSPALHVFTELPPPFPDVRAGAPNFSSAAVADVSGNVCCRPRGGVGRMRSDARKPSIAA